MTGQRTDSEERHPREPAAGGVAGGSLGTDWAGAVTLSVGDAIRSAAIRAVILRERWQSGVAYNPLSARATRDPYPAYAALRARAPVHRSRLLRGLVFTRHADVGAILRDHRRFANDPRKGTLSSRQLAMLPPPHDYTLLFLDPPDHTRLGALISKAFTPRGVNAYESRIRGIAEALVDGLDDPAGFDLMRAVARPLPAIVIAEMLGVPVEDRARFRVWARRRARLLEPTIGPRERKAGDEALREFDAYFRPVIEERRTAPGDDIVSGLVRALDEGEQLSERETLNMLRLLVGTGTETTADLIGNGILALLRSPDQLQRLREDPAPDPGRRERTAALRSSGANRFSARGCGLRGERPSGAETREHRARHRGGQPRSGRVRETGPVGCRPPPGSAPVVRARDSPLSRSLAGAPARPDRTASVARAVLVDGPWWGPPPVLQGHGAPEPQVPDAAVRHELRHRRRPGLEAGALA